MKRRGYSTAGWVKDRTKLALAEGLMEMAARNAARGAPGWRGGAGLGYLEWTMLFALDAVAQMRLGREAVALINCDMHSSSQERRAIEICAQHRIESYRADFLVTSENPQRGRLSVVVEVDGHDFHERTKKQASHDKERDRSMQRLGFLVFRFTGSDINSDPIACADEVICVALGSD